MLSKSMTPNQRHNVSNTLKKFHSHVLLRRLRAYLRQSGIKHYTINHRLLHVQGGILTGFTFKPDKNYCRVTVMSPLFTPKVWASFFDFHCNYSLEALFYKLYKHGLISLDNYTRLLKPNASHDVC